MKISTHRFVLIFLFLFIAVEVSHAQMINYNRRNRRRGIAVKSQQTAKPQTRIQSQPVKPKANYYTAPAPKVEVTEAKKVEVNNPTESMSDSIQAALQEQETIEEVKVSEEAKETVAEVETAVDESIDTMVSVESFDVPTGDVQVTNRVERLYDLNRDGLLQQGELTDFYKDVVSSVRNKGKFKVSSDLLKTFDTDNDGEIGRYEVSGLVNQLN